MAKRRREDLEEVVEGSCYRDNEGFKALYPNLPRDFKDEEELDMYLKGLKNDWLDKRLFAEFDKANAAYTYYLRFRRPEDADKIVSLFTEQRKPPCNGVTLDMVLAFLESMILRAFKEAQPGAASMTLPETRITAPLLKILQGASEFTKALLQRLKPDFEQLTPTDNVEWNEILRIIKE